MKSEIQILTSFSPACLFSVVSSLYIWSRLLDHFTMNIQTIYNNNLKKWFQLSGLPTCLYSVKQK